MIWTELYNMIRVIGFFAGLLVGIIYTILIISISRGGKK